MKVIERQQPGYDEAFLAGFAGAVRFPSEFFDETAVVRGICFASGSGALEDARSLAEHHLRRGTIELKSEALTESSWTELLELLSPPKMSLTNLAVILPEADRLTGAIQNKVADAVFATAGTIWLLTASDFRRITPRLRLALAIYLGLAPTGKMRFLAQSGQSIVVDEGSYQPAKRPAK